MTSNLRVYSPLLFSKCKYDNQHLSTLRFRTHIYFWTLVNLFRQVKSTISFYQNVFESPCVGVCNSYCNFQKFYIVQNFIIVASHFFSMKFVFTINKCRIYGVSCETKSIEQIKSFHFQINRKTNIICQKYLHKFL